MLRPAVCEQPLSTQGALPPFTLHTCCTYLAADEPLFCVK